MGRQDPGRSEALATLTHARLRLAQGDVATARAILETLRSLTPEDERIGGMLAALDDAEHRPGRDCADEALPPRQPGDPRRLADEFRRGLGTTAGQGTARRRIDRLERWLRRLSGAGRGPGASADR